MRYLIAFFIIVICFYVFLLCRLYFLFQHARRKGLLSKVDKLTMFDVRQLIMQGEIDLAVWVYRKIFKVNDREAKKSVDELVKNIHQKNKEAP